MFRVSSLVHVWTETKIFVKIVLRANEHLVDGFRWILIVFCGFRSARTAHFQEAAIPVIWWTAPYWPVAVLKGSSMDVRGILSGGASRPRGREGGIQCPKILIVAFFLKNVKK